MDLFETDIFHELSIQTISAQKADVDMSIHLTPI